MVLTPKQMEDQLLRLTDRVDTLTRKGNTDPRIPLLATDFDVEDAIFSNHAKYVVKTANETLASSTTLQDDDALLFPVGGFEHWGFEFFILWASPTAADIKFAITAPSGATGIIVVGRQEGTSSSDPSFRGGRTFGGSFTINAPSTGDMGNHLWGAVLTGATDGNVTLQWAQDTSDGTDTTVFASSWLKAVRID